jgi:hypothetical protein
MSLTLTYDANLARVIINCTGLPTVVDYATVERSIDQIQWTQVRGGSAVVVTAGVMAEISDYEFDSDVVNYYRARGVDSAGPGLVGVNSSVAADGGTNLTPALPAGVGEGDTVYIYASTRNSGVGTVDVPANWTAIAASGNIALLGRIYDGVWTMPTVTFSGDVVGDTNLAFPFAFRNSSLTAHNAISQLNGSAQNIAIPALPISEDHCVFLTIGWKQDDWTSVAPPAGQTEILDGSSTTGNDAGHALYYSVQTNASNAGTQTLVVTGGASAISRGMAVAISPRTYLVERTANITPALGGVWMKSLRRPFLNREVTVLDFSDIERPARVGVFDIIGRSAPVAVTDVRGSRRWTMTILAADATEAEAIDTMLVSGDLQFVHVPADCPVPGGYVVVGDTTERKTRPHAVRRHFDLPLTEIAAPGADIVGAISTWQTVLNNYATWADLIADKATWQDVLNLIGDPSEVIVP